ncbi:glutamate-rich WD repeat-containing protein 1 [Thrips palmi]|uniref:Glutamate-rich WD repeat-containing protein 1 n=1 Tax=Thrips palmi TaxID=161013 RepID=A0A6P8ZZ45_THRPL|nr:glutamate-rich WD repeat-containing protein 1 [Thrips palmi]
MKMEDEQMEVENDEEMVEDGTPAEKTARKVYLPGKPLNEGEVLECDDSVYLMRHECKAGSPCLSFDIIKDNLGDNREAFPHTAYIVGGTQSPKKGDNCLLVIKMSNLVKTQIKDDDSSDEDDESEDEDNDEVSESKKPIMHFSILKHLGCVNRVRSMEINGTVLAASWSELARVSIWNLNKPIRDVELNKQLPKKVKREGYGKMANSVSPEFIFTGHQTEGYGIDWSPTMPGVLATGDCTKHIHVWTPDDNLSSWKVDQRPLMGHTDSVEDLQWSPNEPHVLASCSVDKSIRIWDTRAAPNKANQLTVAGAHLSDVNVISWNKKEPFIISGGDDGFLHIWDLRQFKAGASVATFKHHTQPVTTVEWHPTEPSVFASGGADNQIALWDLSVEKDSDTANEEDIQELPPQLLFIHQGQRDIKELHWHPQITSSIISTAQNGFNVFRTISV